MLYRERMLARRVYTQWAKALSYPHAFRFEAMSVLYKIVRRQKRRSDKLISGIFSLVQCTQVSAVNAWLLSGRQGCRRMSSSGPIYRAIFEPGIQNLYS